MKSGLIVFVGLVVFAGFFVFVNIKHTSTQIRPIETRSVSIDNRTIVKRGIDSIEKFINIPLNLFEK